MNKPIKNLSVHNDSLPQSMIIAGAWSWRLLVIVGAIGVFIYLASIISEVIIPFAIAILFAALLVPVVNTLKAKGWPKSLAVLTALTGSIVVVGGLIYLIINQIHAAIPDLKSRGKDAYSSLKEFLASPAIGFNQHDIDNALKSLTQYFHDHSQMLTAGLTSAGDSLAHIVVGLLLLFFTLIFILVDGKHIWQFFVHLLPRKAQPAINGSGEVSWLALKAFVRSQVIVAAFNGTVIGIGAFILGLPLAIPVGILVFLGSFIPVIGAILTGAVAVVIALIFNGWVSALFMLGILVFVQEFEGHVLQPFLIGKAVNIHPLAIVLSVAIGTIIGGIPGALFAVPFVAVLTKTVTYISHRTWEKESAQELIEA